MKKSTFTYFIVCRWWFKGDLRWSCIILVRMDLSLFWTQFKYISSVLDYVLFGFSDHWYSFYITSCSLVMIKIFTNRERSSRCSDRCLTEDLRSLPAGLQSVSSYLSVSFCPSSEHTSRTGTRVASALDFIPCPGARFSLLTYLGGSEPCHLNQWEARKQLSAANGPIIGRDSDRENILIYILT